MTLQTDIEDDDALDWPDGDSLEDDAPQDSGQQAEPSPEPSPDSQPETRPKAKPDSPPEILPDADPDDDLDKLRQRVRSAEGRYEKFGQDIDDMRRQLADRESLVPDQEALSDTPVLPEGWNARDWEDFATDSPTEAELLQANAREQAKIRQRLDTFEQQQLQQASLNAFRQTIMDAHPDYDALMASEGEQVRQFIDGQSNSLVKKAYQQVYLQGTADEVVELVNQYKLSKGKPEMLERRVRDSLAVPSRSPVPDTNKYGGLPDENDEDGAWDYFDDEKI